MHVFKVLICSIALLMGRTGVIRAEVKAEPLAKPAPSTVSAPLSALLENQGWQIISDDGKVLLNIWLRKEVKGSSKPAGPKGNILFPFLSEGEFLGVVEVVGHVGDYRDQQISPGVFTFRYGVQPINGDHLGASPYRDFGLLIPAKTDQKPELLVRKNLEHASAEAAGTSHPAIMMFLAPEAGGKAGQVVRDDANDRNSVILPLNILSGSEKSAVMIQWIVTGRAPV